MWYSNYISIRLESVLFFCWNSKAIYLLSVLCEWLYKQLRPQTISHPPSLLIPSSIARYYQPSPSVSIHQYVAIPTLTSPIFSLKFSFNVPLTKIFTNYSLSLHCHLPVVPTFAIMSQIEEMSSFSALWKWFFKSHIFSLFKNNIFQLKNEIKTPLPSRLWVSYKGF